jgi:hypothetical protein
MKSTRLIRLLAGAALAAAPTIVMAQFSTPNVITTPGSVTKTLGSTIVINQGLVGVGRISASALDSFGETFGSVSGLQITNWVRNPDGSYGGVFNVLPDRGYNSGSFFSDYAARINQVGFAFTPYTGAAGIGGTTIAEKLTAQNEIRFTTPITGVKFTDDDPISGPGVFTTGLDPGAGTGKWNGRPGYTFEAVATDRGEPGARRDTFALIVKDSQGREVVRLDDRLSRGNIQSSSLLGWWW